VRWISVKVRPEAAGSKAPRSQYKEGKSEVTCVKPSSLLWILREETLVPERHLTRSPQGRLDSLTHVTEKAVNTLSQLVTIQSSVKRNEVGAAQRNEVAGGLLYCHSRLNSNTSKLLESSSFLYALVELLTEKGLLQLDELEERKREVAVRLLDSFLDRGMGVAMQADERDKYTFDETVEIDCENRVDLCKAACCRMSFALSQQDVEEGVIKWDLGRPYLIAQDSEGYCSHLDRESSCCRVRAQRPLPCRGYDCRQDNRVWLDFEKRIVNPDLEQLFADNNAQPTKAS
jgi:hypothetical protein